MTERFEELIVTAEERNLTEEEAAAAMEILADGGCGEGAIERFLLTPALSFEDVDAATLAGLAGVVRERAISLPGVSSENLIDTCGTGGGVSTFNVSTAAAFCLAGARFLGGECSSLAVAKHGNRAIASTSGSADVLERLGVPVEGSPEQVASSVRTNGFGFLFAPRFHKAFAFVMPVRKRLAAQGRRTAFNLIGPLANPARAAWQVMGVFVERKLSVMAEVLERLGVRGAVCASGRSETGEAMDEISISGPTRIIRFRGGERFEEELEPGRFGVRSFPVSALRVGSAEESAERIRNILSGKGEDRAGEAIVRFNTAAGLVAACGWDWDRAFEEAGRILAEGWGRKVLDSVIASATA